MMRILLSFLLFVSLPVWAEKVVEPETKKEYYEDLRETEMALRAAISYARQNEGVIGTIIDKDDYRKVFEAISKNSTGKLLQELDPPVFVIRDSKKRTSRYSFNHPIDSFIDLGLSLLAQNDRENLLNSYRTIFDSIPEKFAKMLPHPRTLIKADLKKLKNSMTLVDNFFAKYLDVIVDQRMYEIEKDPGHDPIPREVADESGYKAISSSRYSDHAAKCAPSDYHPDGIINKTKLAKDQMITTIKNQGGRGTCVAFAYAAVAESEKIRNGYTPSNFSEQSIYAYASLIKATSNKWKDGLNVKKTAKKFKKKKYVIPYEKRWVYNPSRSRGSYSNKFYSNSCDDYPYYCSNRSFQCKKNSNGKWAYVGAGNATGPYINSYSSLKAWRKSKTMDRLIALDRPAVIGIQTDRLFRNSLGETDGYIRLDRHYGSSKKGGHAMMYVGYVKNKYLPSGVRKAKGGGYVVVKNSYGIETYGGTARHDCGFYYLDHDYVKDRITSLVTINI